MTPEEFFTIWQTVALPKELTYRLYYDENGLPLVYSMEELPGKYIEIDQATYNQSSRRVRVKNGQLIKVDTVSTNKLIPGQTGTACDPRDVCVIIDKEPNIKWSLKTYEPD